MFVLFKLKQEFVIKSQLNVMNLIKIFIFVIEYSVCLWIVVLEKLYKSDLNFKI
jgi:hypothetical protein